MIPYVSSGCVSFESDEYHTVPSKSLNKDEELLTAGFGYVIE